MITKRFYFKEHFPKLGENGCNAYMDCYIPSAFQDAGEAFAKKKYPCMIVCPGGGYGFTSDREAEGVALQFVAEGYRAVVVRYSVAPHVFPQHLREIAGAMELIYQNAKEWNIDVNRTAIMGFSAGAHLAAQYSNRYDCPEVREIFPESKPVQASILSYPVITDDPQYKHAGSIQNYLGYEPTEQNEKGCANECVVSEKTPPTFIWHTAEDKAVPVQNSLLYAKALSDCKVPFEMHIYPFGEHGLSTVDGVAYVEEKPPHVARVRKWLEDVKTWLKMIGV
ncbi:MAG: alpha/beta hydrolase [Tyzzerella sp.]|nr:alpha/beta hydrolase [Tyzzerella sp.]